MLCVLSWVNKMRQTTSTYKLSSFILSNSKNQPVKVVNVSIMGILAILHKKEINMILKFFKPFGGVCTTADRKYTGLFVI